MANNELIPNQLCIPFGNDWKPLSRTKSSAIYELLRNRLIPTPKVPFPIAFEWLHRLRNSFSKKAYQHLFLDTHGQIQTFSSLSKWKTKKDGSFLSPSCPFCNEAKENTIHRQWLCPSIQTAASLLFTSFQPPMPLKQSTWMLNNKDISPQQALSIGKLRYKLHQERTKSSRNSSTLSTIRIKSIVHNI